MNVPSVKIILSLMRVRDTGCVVFVDMMSGMMIQGFDRAQANYEAQEPPEPQELTSIDVIFTVRIGMDVDLSEYLDDEDSWPILAAAMAMIKKEIEGNIVVKGRFNGDKLDPLPTDDIEIYDFDVKWVR